MAQAVLHKPSIEVSIRDKSDAELSALSSVMKLSLSVEDMKAIQIQYKNWDRDPILVELEVIAQTWSEHCKHRIFNAVIHHTSDGKQTMIDSLFNTYIKQVTQGIQAQKPGFILSAFHDNAGFIRLDDQTAVCLKAETHNHPSAIEPYAGANTGLGGVIRDILGAGKGAKPIGSLDVLCFGKPNTSPSLIKTRHVIHPLGIMRGVVRGVRDYGNRMGIPTVTGAIHFEDGYLYNPLVFCGTAGMIPTEDIDKKVVHGLKVILLGGATGRDGLHGATFSSTSLDTESHEEDQGAVQIGNPIEEKKACDCILKAREEGLIDFITDCGAGGLSSATGEMLSKTGGTLYLEEVPLKEPGLSSWEIFLSESQERMVLGIQPQHTKRLFELAGIYETQCAEIGEADNSGHLKVYHDGKKVCDLDCSFLHTSPQKTFRSHHQTKIASDIQLKPTADWGNTLKRLLKEFNVCSREPIIREYDHEVQGNTIIKPLAGALGDNPQDGSVLRVDQTEKYISLGVSLLPQYNPDPYRMGLSSVDETIRQLVVTGADPDRIALLDNFCVGNPDDPNELGKLVECIKGIADAARAYQAPFISGKDSFYNYFETDEGPESIPLTILISGIGIVENASHITGASIRQPNSKICFVGISYPETGGNACAQLTDQHGGPVPNLNPEEAIKIYRTFYKAIAQGMIRSAHDLSEGGLAVALAEMGFSLKAGLEIDLAKIPTRTTLGTGNALFSESNNRILFEVSSDYVQKITTLFQGLPFSIIGETYTNHRDLCIHENKTIIIQEKLSTLKESWKNGLLPYY
ncbi:MAG: phosphoribosylformylglycinamidine synthase subunit PurL [Kiritimatiellae bacterium]|nr:phosphoribosylformylglycinamidine synthase subunit PurL [Kiritimatiellia bacterium]